MLAPFDVVCDEFENGVGVFVWLSLSVSVYLLTVSNALLMSSDSAFRWFVLVKACAVLVKWLV